MVGPAPSEDRRSASDRKTRKRVTLSFVATVVVLALVIVGIAALSEPERTDVAEEPSYLTTQSQDLYSEAMDKLASGDTTGAIQLLRESSILDPSNADAQDQLDQLTETQQANSNRNASPDPPQEPDPDPDPDPDPTPDEFLQPVDDLSTLLPASIPEFTIIGSPITAIGVSQIPLDPDAGGEYDFRVSRVLLIVHDKETEAAAAEYLDKASKRLFPQHQQTMTVDGAEVYFGTDGGRGATATFYRGRYVFETILAADRDPASALSDVGEAVAAAFPDSLD